MGNETKAAMKAQSRVLSTQIMEISRKFDAKGVEPVSNLKMPVLAEYVAYMKELPSQAMFVDFHLDNQFNVSNTACKFTRSIIPFGGPLKGYADTKTNSTQQASKLKEYVLNNLEASFAKASKGGYSEYLNVYYFMTALIFDIFIQILLMDASLAIVSVALVFIYIWITTGSVFLATVGMSEILLSIPVAWFFVRIIFQIKYFAGLNLL